MSLTLYFYFLLLIIVWEKIYLFEYSYNKLKPSKKLNNSNIKHFYFQRIWIFKELFYLQEKFKWYFVKHICQTFNIIDKYAHK